MGQGGGWTTVILYHYVVPWNVPALKLTFHYQHCIFIARSVYWPRKFSAKLAHWRHFVTWYSNSMRFLEICILHWHSILIRKNIFIVKGVCELLLIADFFPGGGRLLPKYATWSLKKTRNKTIITPFFSWKLLWLIFHLVLFLFCQTNTLSDRFWLSSWQRDQVYTGLWHRQSKVSKASAKSPPWRRKP